MGGGPSSWLSCLKRPITRGMCKRQISWWPCLESGMPLSKGIFSYFQCCLFQSYNEPWSQFRNQTNLIINKSLCRSENIFAKSNTMLVGHPWEIQEISEVTFSLCRRCTSSSDLLLPIVHGAFSSSLWVQPLVLSSDGKERGFTHTKVEEGDAMETHHPK